MIDKQIMKLIKANKKYYGDTVYEFNLPAGHSCPCACKCLTRADKQTGKQTAGEKRTFRCYAASAERFPAVRDSRWSNFDSLRQMKSKEDVVDALVAMFTGKEKAVRIHGSGDFFNQRYFDAWLEVCKAMPDVEFWAFTKSVPFWLARIGEIPDNLVLTASMGGTHDQLAIDNNFKTATVFLSTVEATASGLPIDTDDSQARIQDTNFALVDNYEKKPKPIESDGNKKENNNE